MDYSLGVPHPARLGEKNKPIRRRQPYSYIPSLGGRLLTSSVCVILLRSEAHAEKGRRKSRPVQMMRVIEA